MEFIKQNSYLKEYVLKCPICYELFSSIYKPLIIPCGHTICSHCVENLKKIAQEDYEEEYASDFNDDDLDISLDTDQQENDEETSHNVEENESEEHEASDENEEREEESEEENSIDLGEINYPDINMLNEDAADGQISQGINQPKNLRKIKLKCSICRKKMKIFENEIILNINVMDVINSFDKLAIEELVNLNKVEISEENNIIDTNKQVSKATNNKIFCKMCRFVDTETNHLISQSTHAEYLIQLTQDVFNKMKSNTQPLLAHSPVNILSTKEENKQNDQYNFFDKDNTLRKQINDCVFLFLDKILNSTIYPKETQGYMRNYFFVNSKACYLKHKSFRKLTKLYIKFNKIINEIETTNDKGSENKLPALLKRGEDILDSTNMLLDKYFRITDIYLKNYDKIFNKENLENNHHEPENFSNSKSDQNQFSNLTNKLFQDKIMKTFRSGFFDAYFNQIVDSERRYGTCLENSSNLIYIYDLRIENELEVNYEIIFEHLKDSEVTQEVLETYYSDYIEIDEEGRNLYILGKRAKDSKTFRCYDMNTRTLTDKKKMDIKFGIPDRYFHKDKLYIFGGAKTDLTPIIKCYYYDIFAEFWVDLPSLNLQRYNKSIAFNNNKFYVFGGNTLDDHSSDAYKFEVLDLNKISETNFKWEIFSVNKFNLCVNNYFYMFMSKNVLVVLGGEDFVHYDEIRNGFIIKFNEENFNHSEVIEEFKIKNSLVNNFNVCSSFRGLIIGSRLGDGYFTKMNFKNNLKKIKNII